MLFSHVLKGFTASSPIFVRFKPLELCNLAWAFSKLQVLNGMQLLGQQCLQKMQEMNPQEPFWCYLAWF